MELNCSRLGSLEYRRLCQVLSLPVSNDGEGFTGNKQTDLIILSNLSDNDLINICAANKYLNNLCNDDNFWLNKILNRYNILGNSNDIKQYIPTGTTWKEYYLWLSGMLAGDPNLAYLIALKYDRSDLLTLLERKEREILPQQGIFLAPIYLNKNMIDFLREANLGPSDPNNPYSVPVNDLLLGSTYGVSTRRNIAGILNLYFTVNGLTDDGYYRADSLIYKYFGDIFEKIKARKNFDTNRFRRIVLHGLINQSISRVPLIPINMNRDELIERLDAEKDYLSGLLKHYRSLR